jgi:hypothetical protein
MIRSQNVITSTTWANKPSSYLTGQPVFISDVGTKGSHWFYDGTRWKALTGTAHLASLDSASTAANNSETIVFQYLIPANVLQVGDVLRFWGGMVKSGSTDTGSIRIRVGTAGTTADSLIISVTNMSAATRQFSPVFDLRVNSATVLDQVSNSTAGYGGAVTTAAVATAAISNISNALYYTVSLFSSSTNDTVQLEGAQLQLITKAN